MHLVVFQEALRAEPLVALWLSDPGAAGACGWSLYASRTMGPDPLVPLGLAVPLVLPALPVPPDSSPVPK